MTIRTTYIRIPGTHYRCFYLDIFSSYSCLGGAKIVPDPSSDGMSKFSLSLFDRLVSMFIEPVDRFTELATTSIEWHTFSSESKLVYSTERWKGSYHAKWVVRQWLCNLLFLSPFDIFIGETCQIWCTLLIVNIFPKPSITKRRLKNISSPQPPK